MRGTGGLADRAALKLPSGHNVFHQPDPARTDGGYLLPFHVDTTKVDGQGLRDLDHSWNGTHLAWDEGRNDDWIATKTELSMSYFTQTDIPFHRAVAKSFTTCDNYFSSVQGPTTPNRLYLWTGTIDPEGEAGGPVIANPAVDYVPVYNWTTYPERLQKAGISWQVYANQEIGNNTKIPFCGDYGDNPLWFFQNYTDSLNATGAKAQELARRGGLHKTWLPDSGLGKNVDHVLSQFIADCRADTLPAVSWVVAPYGYSEHPAARPVDGAAYTHGVLKALFDNPKLWESTVVLLDFDENDGFFDHLLPPVAPPGTAKEYIAGRPIGLGPRVPMTVVSPWSRGGWINSQVFDHTSVIRFLETWTGVHEPNISPWRRSICGDLTSCFDFTTKRTTIPLLPDTAALRAEADRTQTALPAPTPPKIGDQVAPSQEPGRAPARAIGYQPTANLAVSGTNLAFHLANSGSAALQLSVYSSTGSTLTPERFDLAARNGRASGAVSLATAGAYDVAVHGPNGFIRTATGNSKSTTAGLEAALVITGSATRPALELVLSNHGTKILTASVEGLTKPAIGSRSVQLKAGRSRSLALDPVADAGGWYELTVTLAGNTSYVRTFAGHLENGRSSVTG